MQEPRPGPMIGGQQGGEADQPQHQQQEELQASQRDQPMELDQTPAPSESVSTLFAIFDPFNRCTHSTVGYVLVDVLPLSPCKELSLLTLQFLFAGGTVNGAGRAGGTGS